MGRVLRLAMTHLQRDLRSGEMTLIALALIVAVAAMSAVSLFVNRIERALAQQGSALLAADAVIESPNPIPTALERLAHAHGLSTAHSLAFRSVVQLGDKMQLAEIKAVDASYPLRGTLRIADTPFGSTQDTRAIPEAGTLWAENRLLQALGVPVGGTVTVGASTLRVTKVLVLEPDRGGDFFSIAPRLLMNLQDVPATELVLPGSRVSYRLLVSGETAQVRAFRAEALAQLDQNQKILDVRDARPELRAALERADLFLGMAALIAVIIAGAAIALASRRYAQRHLDPCAIMRCLGATQSLIVRTLTVEMLALAVTASLAGVVVGYIGQFALAHFLDGLIGGTLPSPSLSAVLAGLGIGVVVLLGFALAPLLSLKDVPPLRVLRRELQPLTGQGILSYALEAAAIAVLAPWHTHDHRLSAYLLGGCMITVLALTAVAWITVRSLNRLRTRVGISWRYGLASVARRAGSSSMQIVALGLGIMAMLLITLVRDDLLAGWRQKVPADAPNQFIINIPPAEVQPIQAFLRQHGLHTGGVFPMVRGRLTHINGVAVNPERYADARARRLAEREFNLSWATALQPDNRITSGRWWSSNARPLPQFSVETSIAETLGIKLGDSLTYQIIDRSITAPIMSLRAVQWDTFNVNFFVIAAPGLLESFPATYITSFHLDESRKALLNDLVRRFPSITVIDVAALLTQVHLIIQRVSNAVQSVFWFTLLAGALVLVAAIQATQDERARESALLKSLGATRATVARGLLAEFLVLGFVAGVLAAAAATLIGWLLATQVFHVEFRPNPWLWPTGTIAGLLGVAVFGLIGLRQALNQPPATVLRVTS